MGVCECVVCSFVSVQARESVWYVYVGAGALILCVWWRQEGRGRGCGVRTWVYRCGWVGVGAGASAEVGVSHARVFVW
jgi:hypothetical protein